MKLTINGEIREVPDNISIEELIDILGIKAPNYAVAVGMEVVPKSEYRTWHLKEGDKVEIVTFVGGG